MFYGIRKLYRPEIYQGHRVRRRYFEGWYFKSVFSDTTLAVIPGISKAEDDPHAFVQVFDGAGMQYHRFPVDAFSAARDRFEVRVEENRFSLDGFSLELPDHKGSFSITGRNGWPSRLLQPGTMGWYSFVPFMECKHGILTMDAEVSGTLNGKKVAGRFYCEKDYGRSFPSAWIWMQSNSFAGVGRSVTCSVATIPFLGSEFAGFLAAILADGTLYRFTTYNGSKLEEIVVDEEHVRVVLRRRKTRLVMEAVRAGGVDLLSPVDGMMTGRVNESLDASIHARLEVAGEVVFDGTGSAAGLEVVDAAKLKSFLTADRRRRG